MKPSGCAQFGLMHMPVACDARKLWPVPVKLTFYLKCIALVYEVLVTKRYGPKEGNMDFDKEYASYVDDAGVSEIQALEKETGSVILAYTERPVPAELPKSQLDKIRKLEKKLCVRLVAYQTH